MSLRILIHAPLAGCDPCIGREFSCFGDFNPRTPCGVRPSLLSFVVRCTKFQSTHPLRGATKIIMPIDGQLVISIHAPLAGCDQRGEQIVIIYIISIHAPLAGCDFRSRRGWWSRRRFQSTHPLRGATSFRHSRSVFLVISIHAPLAGCDEIRKRGSPDISISIHAPLAGCDQLRRRARRRHPDFNPRTPCGVRPTLLIFELLFVYISIHAPLAGCDT